jgi:hypothetical protein
VVESLNEPVSFKRWHTLGGQKQVLAKTKEKELKTTPATASGLMVGLWLSLNVLVFLSFLQHGLDHDSSFPLSWRR